MEPESDALSLIRTTFPNERDLVERAYRQSRSFRDLCQDYRRCLAALQRWDQQQEKEGPARRHEYTELLEELSEEIRASLAAPDELDDRDKRSLSSPRSRPSGCQEKERER